MRRLTLVAALLAAPVVAHAQFVGHGFPFDEVIRAYTLHGCGDASFRIGSAPLPAFCLDGVARLGYTDLPGGERIFHVTTDFAGTRIAGFDGIFTDVDYSGIQLGVQYRRLGGAVITEGAYVYTDPDLTGFHTYGVPDVTFSDIDPQSFQLASGASSFLGYYTLDESQAYRNLYGPNGLQFSLAVTSIPEPATLALTFGGLVLVAGIAARRRKIA